MHDLFPGVGGLLYLQLCNFFYIHCISLFQWFGNLVTNEWWSDLWLNEGFASYVEYAGVNKVEPNWRMVGLPLLHVLFPECLV